MAGNLAVPLQDGVLGLALLATVTAAVRAWMVRIAPPAVRLATVRSQSRPEKHRPSGYTTTR
jgi:hypothetical protein